MVRGRRLRCIGSKDCIDPHSGSRDRLLGRQASPSARRVMGIDQRIGAEMRELAIELSATERGNFPHLECRKRLFRSATTSLAGMRMQADMGSPSEFLSITCSLAGQFTRVLFDEQFEEIAIPSIKTFSRRPTKERAPWRGSLRSRTET